MIRRDVLRAAAVRPGSSWGRWWTSLCASLLLHTAAIAALVLHTVEWANRDVVLYTAALAPAWPGEEQTLPTDGLSSSALPQEAAPEELARMGVSNYWSSVRMAVARRVRYPADALSRDEEGVVLVRLTVDGNGGLADVTVMGDAPARLVEAARDAVRRAAPFAPPTGEARGAISAVIPVRFAMNGMENKARRNPWME